MDVFDVLVLATLILTSVAAQENNICTTPDSKQGQCIDLKICPVLISLLTTTGRPLPPEVINFLRKSQCGFNGNSPLVCCPVSTVFTSETTSEIVADVVKPVDVSNHPNLVLLPLNICGPVSGNKIINGKKTSLFQYPWMALIGYNRVSSMSNTRVFRCGGSVINEKYVLTAAHCITDLPSSLKLASVRLGEHDLESAIDCMDEEGEEVCADPYVEFDVEDSFSHQNYSLTHLQNDIGLIRIKGTANFRSDSIKPICLPLGADQNRNLEGQNVIVSGWGTTEKGISSSVLLEVELPVMRQEQCAEVYSRNSASNRNPIRIRSGQMCAGGVNAQDSCDGDSGGPLIFKGEVNLRPRFVQYGIVSFGPRSCGVRGFPGVYTKVAFYVDWILNVMKP